MPALAIGAQPAGPTLERQLCPVPDDLTAAGIEDCGHIIPQHRPDALLGLLERFSPPGEPGGRQSMSLKTLPVGSVTTAIRPNGVSTAGATTAPPSRVTAACAASVPATLR